MNPAVGFHFQVIFTGLDSTEQTEEGFQSITGLEADIDTSALKNDTTAKLGKENISFPSLVLRRAVPGINNSPLTQWVFSWINLNSVTPLKKVSIELLGEDHKPIMSWSISNVMPKSWKLGELNAEKSEILFETIELTYTGLSFEPVNEIS